MVTAVLQRVVPAWLYGGYTAFRTVSSINTELRKCRDGGEAAAVVEGSKGDLYACLRGRFPHLVAQALTIKILNICLAKYHLNARSSRVLSRPIGLIVDPSNMCRLACPGCVHSKRVEELRLFDWGKGTLSAERFEALLKRYGPYAIGFCFYNYGEPLLNLNTPKYIRLAKTYLLKTALSTSLSVTRFDADAYVESGLDFMVVSIDGATQRVYERFRRNGNLELVLENLRALVDAKRRAGSRTPVLSWNFLAFEHNAHEIPLAERMASEMGVNFFRVVNPFDVAWDDPEIRPAAVKARMQTLDWRSRVEAPPLLAGEIDADAIGSAFDRRWNDVDRGAEPGPGSGPGQTCHRLYQNMVNGRGREDTAVLRASRAGSAIGVRQVRREGWRRPVQLRQVPGGPCVV